MVARPRPTPEATARVCPICAMPVAQRAQNPAFPFCRPACKLVDLGRWFSGAYRIPETRDPDALEDEDGEKHSVDLDSDADDGKVES